MPEVRHCPQCGAELSAESPLMPCPACLMKLGLDSWQEGQRQGPTQPHSPVPRFAPPSPDQLAERFPGLDVLDLIGQGGMGAVYKARQKDLDRLVALKVLPPESAQDPAFAERFSREAKALARLNHPHIVTVHAFGQADGLYYLIMEYVDGVNLRQALETGPFDPRQALAVVPKVCDALQYAHDEGVVHRDIKPENILLDKKGRVKIADFGLAKLLGRASSPLTLTGTHDVMGTPRYMAPEQYETPAAVDHRADIYSLGVVFYEMLTGELPLGRFAPPSHKVQVDMRLDEVVLRALAKEPERRYQSAGAVKTAVETIASSPVVERLEPAFPAATDIDWARAQVRGPARGLLLTGILTWAVMPIVVGILLLIAADRDLPIPDALFAGLAPAFFVGAGVVIAAGLMMMRLRSYKLAVLGSVLAMVVTPGNLLGFPIGIWALVVLSQRGVREAFRREAMTRKGETRHGVDSFIQT